LAVSTDSTGFKQVALAVFQQVFYWSSNRFSTSCDWLAVEFSQTKTAIEGAIPKETAIEGAIPKETAIEGAIVKES